MILKKPFAILIKYFKVIHFALVGLAILLAFKTNDILKFLNEFIAHKTSSFNATGYASNLNYLIIILIVGICIVIFDLLRRKKKPRMLYLYIIIVYLATFGILVYTSGNLQIIEEAVLEAKTLRLVRDILRVDVIVQYIAIAVIIVRALGFDIKKFDFEKDINELQIDVTDNEEFELTLGVDTDKLKREGRKQIRQFRYYLIENKQFVRIASGIILIVVTLFIITKIDFTKRNFKENTVITTPLYKLSVTGSYITQNDYKLNKISTNNTSYVIVRLNIQAQNNSNSNTLETDDFLLNVNKTNITPTKKYYQSFSDIGVGYVSQNITTTSNTYILVYNVDNKYLKKKMKLRYKEGFEIKNKDLQASERQITLKPINLDTQQETTVNTYLKEPLSLNNRLYPNTQFTIEYTNIQGIATVTTTHCSEINIDDCYNTYSDLMPKTNNGAILSLIISTNNIDSNVNSINKLITNNGVIKYELAGKEYKSKLFNDLTPAGHKAESYFEIDKQARDADNVWLELRIRNQLYIYNFVEQEAIS